MPKSSTVTKSSANSKGGIDAPAASVASDPILAAPEPQPAPALVVTPAPAPVSAPAVQAVLLTTPSTPALPATSSPTGTAAGSDPSSSATDAVTTLDLAGGELPQPAIPALVISQPLVELFPVVEPTPVIVVAETPAPVEQPVAAAASIEPPAASPDAPVDAGAAVDTSSATTTSDTAIDNSAAPAGTDTAIVDAPAADSSLVDAVASGVDTLGDTSAIDTSAVNTSAIDAGSVDTGSVATSPVDSSAIDTSAADTSSADASLVDTSSSMLDAVDTTPVVDAPVYVYDPLTTTDNYSPAQGAISDAHYAGVSNASAAAQAVLAADSGIVLVDGSAKLNAAGSAVGLYDGAVADVGIGAGLVMTSGTLGGFTNTLSGFGQSNGAIGDNGLNQVVNTVFNTYTYDAAVLEFSFNVAEGVSANSVSFDLVFGSDEFPEWVNSYVDSAAVWVNGTNYALFNHSDYNPLSVVSQNVGAGYFRDNTGATLDTEYDGISELLKITAPIHAGVNTIRIAIADTGDSILDSAVYLANMKAGISSGSGVTTIDGQGTSGNDLAEGTQMAEYFDLSYGDDSLNAGLGDDLIDSGDGNDDIAGDAGNDAINGGAGDDSARYHGNSADFTVTLLDNGSYQVVDNRPGSPDGTDTLDGVEKLHFDDGTFAIDTLLNPPAPTAADTAAAASTPVAVETPPADPVAADPLVAELAPVDPINPVGAVDPVVTDTTSIDTTSTDAGTTGAATDPTPTDPLASDPVAVESASATASAQQDTPVDNTLVVDAAPADATPPDAAPAAPTPDTSAIDTAAQAAVDATQAAAAAETAKLLAGLTLNGTIGSDSLTGNIGNDTLDGGAGADQMAGGAGNDSYYVDDKKDVVSEGAGDGIDTVYASTNTTLSANVENLTLIGSGSEDGTGNALDNILIGNSAKNVLSGGAGHDVLQGGGGIDQLTGGSGNDYFVFSSTGDSLVGAKHDVITDFGQGDLIDLSQIDAITATSMDDAFSYLGSGAFTGVAGQLHFDASTGNLSGDVNGDGSADFEINLAGVSAAPSYDSFQF